MNVTVLMRIHKCSVLLLGIVFLGFVGNAPAVELIKWTGCGITKKAFMGELAKTYQEKTGVVVSLSGGGATKGIRSVNDGNADIGGNCRPALPLDYPGVESNVEMYLVAWDALVPVVHGDNPVNSISSQQLQDVLTGKISNWKDLGGEDKPIFVLAREGKISGVGYMTRKIIFSGANVDYSSNASLMKSSGPLENKIAFDPYAVGVTGMSSAKKRIESGKKMKILMVDGVEASKGNIGTGRYPFFRPLYLSVNPKSLNYNQTKKFIDWVLTSEAQSIIDSVGTVNLYTGKELKNKFNNWENKDKIVNFSTLP